MANTYKKAALYLHGLHQTDRAWLLERLSATQRNKVSPLLQELTDLGIPEHSLLVNDINTVGSEFEQGETSSIAEAHGEQKVQVLKRQLAAVAEPSVLNVLSQQENYVVAAITQMAPWPWLPALQDKMGSELSLSPTERLTPAMQGSLLEALLELAKEDEQQAQSSDIESAPRRRKRRG